ncbi:MAG TPA: hypothetical protein VGN88_05875, partial [Phycisphaerae bacterium]
NALVSARTLLYAQGISQNIDSGAWDKLDATDPAATPNLSSIARLDLFRHDFLWSMHDSGGGTGDANVLLAGRLWSSSDGKGRDKYPMVLCAQLTEMPDRFATNIVLPFLAKVHEKCLTANSAETIRQLISHEREELRSHIKDSLSIEPLAPRQLAAIANHPDMHTAAPTPAAAAAPVDGVPVADPAAAIAASASAATSTAPVPPPSPLRATAGEGFHRIVYQFARGMSAFRTPAAKATSPRRPEQVRLPSCGMSSRDALLFWMRFAYTFVDPSTPMLLFAPDQVIGGTTQTGAPWVDLIAGDPGPSNLFCIKAGTKSLPFTSDIPYTIDPSLVRAIDNHIAHCSSMADSSPLPPWPMFQ